MNLFINDIPIHIVRKKERPDAAHFDQILDARKDAITKTLMVDRVLVTHVGPEHLDAVLAVINAKVLRDSLVLTIVAEDYDALKLYLRKKFRIIKAAGGVIRKKNKLLMIYRLKKWDLPKGKRETGETYKQTAVREINEECNVDVKLGRKVCTTWHTYTMNKKSMLKKTKWYAMDLVRDSKMKPSLEEDIEELRWMSKKETTKALENSYNSIHFVLQAYYRKFDPDQALN